MPKGNRKMWMMAGSYATTALLGFGYMHYCAQFNQAPDASVMMVIFGALGGGHATANVANGMEHKDSGK